MIALLIGGSLYAKNAFERRALSDLVKWTDAQATTHLVLIGKQENGKPCAFYISNTKVENSSGKHSHIGFDLSESTYIQVKDGQATRDRVGSFNTAVAISIHEDLNGNFSSNEVVSMDVQRLLEFKSDRILLRNKDSRYQDGNTYHKDQHIEIFLNDGKIKKVMGVDTVAKTDLVCSIS